MNKKEKQVEGQIKSMARLPRIFATARMAAGFWAERNSGKRSSGHSNAAAAERRPAKRRIQKEGMKMRDKENQTDNKQQEKRLQFTLTTLVLILLIIGIFGLCALAQNKTKSTVDLREAAAVSPTAKIIVDGTPLYKSTEIGRNDVLSLPKRNINKLRISKADGDYFWSSNHGQKLLRVERDIADIAGRNQKYTIFLSPIGDGEIIITHGTPEQCIADTTAANYVEYRRKGGALEIYAGLTQPYPYPHEDLCNREGN